MPSLVTLPTAEQSANIALACAGVAGHPSVADAITRAGSALTLLELINDQPERCGIDLDLVERIDRFGTPAAVAKALELTRRSDLRMIGQDDPEWPIGLRDLGRAEPRMLWVAGATHHGSERPVAITGGSTPTDGAKRHLLEVAVRLFDDRWPVATSFRPGIDRIVLEAANATSGRALVLAHDPQLLRACKDSAHVTAMSENPPGAPLCVRTARRAHASLAAVAARALVVESAFSGPAMHTGVAAAALDRPLAVLAGATTEGDDRLRREFGAREIQTSIDLLRLH